MSEAAESEAFERLVYDVEGRRVREFVALIVNGRVIELAGGLERKLEPPAGEPLKIELESFLNCVRNRSAPVVSGEDGFRALALAIRINEAIAQRSK